MHANITYKIRRPNIALAAHSCPVTLLIKTYTTVSMSGETQAVVVVKKLTCH